MTGRLVFSILLLVASRTSGAGAQIPGPKIVPHVAPHDLQAGLACDDDPVAAGVGCSQFNTAGLLCTGYDLYMVVGQADTNGVAGLTLGIEYNGEPQLGVDVLGWQLCATGLEFSVTDWPDAGSGNVMTWNLQNCGLTEIPPDGTHGTAGVFYVYAYSQDTFLFTANKQSEGGPLLIFANCIGQEWILDPYSEVLGYADFGGGRGCNPCKGYCVVAQSKKLLPGAPCPAVPVAPITWGRIKDLYQ